VTDAAKQVSREDACRAPACGRVAAVGWLLALAVALAVYALTMAPGLVWHDAGYYQTEAAVLDLVRPGEAVRVHPFFLFVAHGLGLLGLWTYAKAASIASAIGTAFLAANVWLIIHLLTRNARAAIVGFLACMLAHTIWQQGVQPQTYGWSNAFLTGMILAAIVYVLSGRTWWLLLFFFLGGAGLSVHLLSQLGLVVLGVWIAVRVLRRQTPAWVIPAGAALWVLGSGLFWYVAWLEYERTGSLGATLGSAFLGGWGSAVFNVGGLLGMFRRSALMLVLNFPTPVALLAAYGLWRSRRLLDGTGLAWVLGALVAVYLGFALRYRVPNQNFFFTPVYALVAVYIGIGVHATGWTRRRGLLALLVALTVAVVPMYRLMATLAERWQVDLRGDGKNRTVPYRNFYTYYLEPWQQNQTGAARFASEVLADLPRDAVLLPDTTTAPPLKYLLKVEHRRPDVRLADPYDARFEAWAEPYWYGDANLLPRLREAGRRVFVVSDHPAYVPRWVTQYGRIEAFGIVYEVVDREQGGGGS